MNAPPLPPASTAPSATPVRSAASVSPIFSFDNSFARELEGLYATVAPEPSPEPHLVLLNRALATSLGLDPEALAGPEGLEILSGNRIPDGAQPLAQAYAGHQFGGFSPQLGDGRALLLGEVIDRAGLRRDIALKGSGRTPFSRGGDGKAALGPVLREYLMGEAMHALGIPTTRALAAVSTGARVFRDRALPGALLTRVASSHLRVGTLQFFAARNEVPALRRIVDYAIARHDPSLTGQEGRYLSFYKAVVQRQAALIAQWMSVGFIHGVMNTDNMTLSGETIDYGPCAFLEAWNPETVHSSIDYHGRYAYGRQPDIAQWNLARLAEALLPLLDADPKRAVEQVMPVLEDFPNQYQAQWLRLYRAKFGLDDAAPAADDKALVEDFLSLLKEGRVDYTLAMRALADAAEGRDAKLRALFADEASVAQHPLSLWLERWRHRLLASKAAAPDLMRQHNPWIIPRNHQVEAALTAAVDHGDMAPFGRLLTALQSPFSEQPDNEDLSLPAPLEQNACYQTFCGT